MARRKWSDIKEKAAPETIEAAARKTEAMLAVLELRDLVRDRGLTQEVLAERLDRAQSLISRTLRREDMHISTLRDVIEALGGELEITARFPDQEYRIRQFDRTGS